MKKLFKCFFILIVMVLFLGYPCHGKCNDDIVKQIWSSAESNDGVNDGEPKWYEGSRDIKYKLEVQPDITMTPIDDDATITIHIDPSRTYQTFIGFGESFEGSTIYNLSRMSSSTRTEALEKLIDPDTGANFNLFRICIGTSDFSPSSWGFYFLDDMPDGEEDPNLNSFSIQKDIDHKIISVLQEALQIAKNKNVNLRFIASPWSPPAWMKDNNSMVGGSLKEKWNDIYAKYLYKFLVAYKNEGIPIYAITIQNEPGWTGSPPNTLKTPCTNMSAEQEADIIKKLKVYLDNDQNIDTKILAYDWNFHDIKHPQDVLQEAKDSVYGVAFHSYDWEPNDEDHIIELYNSYPNLKMFHTERAEWSTDGMDRIIKMFRHLISTYVGWVTMLDNNENGDEQFTGTPTPPSFICDASEPNNYWTTPTYYLKQQFSKFIQLGAVRIYSNVGAYQLSNVAFLNPDNTVVMIVVNQSTNPQGFRVKTGSKQFKATIPGKVVATYKWNAGSIPEPSKNLAAGKTVVVSSTENDTNIGVNVVDGDPDSRWASQWNNDEWIYVDLGDRKQIYRVVLDWENAYGEKYDIQIFDDKSNWITICHEENGFIGINIHDVKGTVTGRYIKMKGITRGTQYGYSLYEFEVYGSDVPPRVCYCYPNPFMPVKGHTKIRFNLVNLSKNASIEIYNIAGERIMKKENITCGFFDWDTKNDSGDNVASGIYIYLIKDDEGKKKGKLGIIK